MGGTAVTASVIVVDTDPVAFVAVTIKLVCANNTVGVPEIIPVLGLIVKLAGSVGVIVIFTGVPVIVGIQLLIA